MADARTDGVSGRHPAGPARTSRYASSTSGRKRWAAGGVATIIATGAFGVLAPPALADVREGRTIEVFYGRDFVGINGYPANTAVRVEVHRGAELIGFAEYPTDAGGFLEINHTGDGDCWQSRFTPNIEPGDKVSAVVAGETPDFTMTRDVFLDDAATVFNAAAGTITVQGHARSTAEAPIAPGDVRELRINLNNGTWSTTGRKDLRADVGGNVDPATGNFTYTFTGLTSADVQNAQSGSEMAIEWSQGGEPALIPELTVFDGAAEPFGNCPPLLPDDRVAPSQVGGVTVTQPALGTVELDWSAANDNVGVTGYVVTRTNLDTNAVATYPAGNELFWSQTRVANGRYSYEVHAVDAAGNAGPKSAAALVGVGVDAPLQAPTGLTTTVTGDSVALRWTAPTGTVASYQVLRGATVVANAVTGTTFTDSAVPVGTHQYTVKARATDGGLSPASAAAAADVVTDTTAPRAPTGLAATVSGSSVALSWTAPTGEAAASYQVLRGATVVAETVTGTTFTNTGVPAGTHSYTVKARDAAGNLSVASAAASATVADTTPPGAPTGVATTVTGSSVAVRWTAPIGEVAASYQVLRGTTVVAQTVTGTTFTNTGVPVGTHSYTVKARDAAGNLSVASAAASATVADTTAPTVSGRTPANGATGVNRNANLTVTFSEAMRATTISSTTVVLKGPAGGVISATVTRDGTTNRWIINPGPTLAAGSRYTLTLTGGSAGIRDVAGNGLVGTTTQPLQTAFTTGSGL